MHFNLALLAAATASTALALPTHEFPPGPYKAAPCTSKLLAVRPSSAICKKHGSATAPGKQFTIIDSISNLAYAQCQAYCIRNLQCHSTYINDSDKTCVLLAETLTDGGFVEGGTEGGFFTDRACSGLKGECNLDNGDFESDSTEPGYSRSWWFPQFEHDAVYNVKAADVGYPPAPSGKKILTMGASGDSQTLTYQNMLVTPSKQYTLSYYFNFHKFHQGNIQHASQYRFYMTICNTIIDGIIRNVTNFDDKWHPRTLTFTAPSAASCTDKNVSPFSIGWYALDPPDNVPDSVLYSSYGLLGLDKISITPSA